MYAYVHFWCLRRFEVGLGVLEADLGVFGLPTRCMDAQTFSSA